MDGAQRLPLGARYMGTFQKMAVGAVYLGMSLSPNSRVPACVCTEGKRNPVHSCIPPFLVTLFLSHVMTNFSFEASSEKDPFLHARVPGHTRAHILTFSLLSPSNWTPCTAVSTLKTNSEKKKF